MPETIQAYLETVQEQIRWKRARPVLLRELERHLEDQRDDFIKEGRGKDEAERLAVQDMGDPVTVGTGLDAVHRPKPQWGLLGLTIALALAGALLRAAFLAPSVRPASQNYNTALVKALASFGFGTAALLGTYFLDISRLTRYARGVYTGALAAGALSLWLFPACNHPSYYTHYVALFYPLVYALWLYSFRGKGWRGLALTILGGVPLSLVCVMIPSVSKLATLLLAGLTLTLCAVWQDWFGIGRKKGLCAILAVVLCMLVWLSFQGYFDSLVQRLRIALHPELDPYGRGYTNYILQLFLKDVPFLRLPTSYGSASHGIGARLYVDKYSTSIDISNDFLPVSIAVEWGWLPLVLLLAALTALLAWLLVKGLRQKYLLGRFVVLAVTLTLGFEALFSVALNLGFIISASLPLVVGNLQTVADMALIGLALSVFRGESIGREEAPPSLRRLKRLRIRIEYQ